MKRQFYLPFLIFYTFLAACHSHDPALTKNNFQDINDDLKSTHGEIIFTAMLFRHGDRYAMSDFPNNPHSKYMKDAGEGVLTKDGKNRAHRLGRWTRQRYDHLLKNKPYSSELLNVISTKSERSVGSALLFLAGFYPPTSVETEIWNQDLLWQPIPIYTDDKVYRTKHYCARFNLEVERVKNSPELLKFHEDHLNTYKFIEKNRQKEVPRDDPIRAIQKASAFYDTMYVQELLELPHLDWVKEVYPKGKDEVQTMFFKLQTYTDQQKRLKGGPLLGHIISELKSKHVKPKMEKVFQFYSGHDVNIVGLLNTMGVWDEKLLPAYCAALIFELRKLNENDYIVTVMYRDSDIVPLQLIEIPTCPDPCSLENFIETTKSFIPEDWDNECKSTDPDYNSILF